MITNTLHYHGNKNKSTFYIRGLIYYSTHASAQTKELKIKILNQAIRDFEKQMELTKEQQGNPIYIKCIELKNMAITAKKAIDGEDDSYGD